MEKVCSIFVHTNITTGDPADRKKKKTFDYDCQEKLTLTNMASRGGPKLKYSLFLFVSFVSHFSRLCMLRHVMTQAINLIFEFLKNVRLKLSFHLFCLLLHILPLWMQKETVQIWLYENTYVRIEGIIIVSSLKLFMLLLSFKNDAVSIS